MTIFKKPKFLLLITIFTGLLLRIIGTWFSLPFSIVHPDEPMVGNVISKILRGNLNPKWFIYPNFYMYIVAGAIFVFLFILLFLKFGISPLQYLKGFDPYLKKLIIFKVGRPISALFGVFLIPLTYKTAKLLFEEKIAIISALMVAVNYSLVLHSHYLTTDAILFFFVFLTFFFSIKYYQKINLKYLILASISSGLATGAKYTGIVSISIIFCALFLRLLENKYSVKKFIIFCLIVLIIACTFFIFTNPFSTIDFRTFKKHFLTISAVHAVKFDRNIIQRWQEIGFIQGKNICATMGLPAFLFSILGILLLIRRVLKTHKFEYILLIFFPVLYFIILINTNNIDERYISLIIPFLSITSSFFIVKFTQNLKKLKHISLSILILISIFFPLIKSIELDKYLLKEDTKILATKWINKNISTSLRYYYETLTVLSPRKNARYTRRIGALSPNDLIKKNIDFLIVNNSYKEYYKDTFKSMYFWIERNCFLLKRFKLKPFQYLNPTIEIFGIDKSKFPKKFKKANVILKVNYKGRKRRSYIIRIDRYFFNSIRPKFFKKTIQRKIYFEPEKNHSIIIHSENYAEQFEKDDFIEISISLLAKDKKIEVFPNKIRATLKPNNPLIKIIKVRRISD